MMLEGKLKCDFSLPKVNNQHAIIMVGQTELHTLSIGENYCTFSLLSRFYFWKGNWDIPNKKILFAYVSLFFLFLAQQNCVILQICIEVFAFCQKSKKSVFYSLAAIECWVIPIQSMTCLLTQKNTIMTSCDISSSHTSSTVCSEIHMKMSSVAHI